MVKRNVQQTLFKTNSNFIAHISWRRFFVCNRDYYSSAMEQLLFNPDQGINTTLLKIDTTTTVAVYEVDGKKLVIKRYNIKGFWHGLKRSVSRSRAIKCWRNAHRLLTLDVPTAKPVAMIEYRMGPLRRRAYYIYEFIPGLIASDVFTKPNLMQPEFSERVEKIVALIKKMLAVKVSHGDLKATNFIFNNNQVFFIDLDAMRTHKFYWLYQRAKHKDINRFLENWEGEIEIKKLFEEKLGDCWLSN